ncbi:nucleotide disphospho-sugar-binding domain-containing protein [Amycolatopsis sp. NPDC059090]|uniref:nucleotide disphospho-sugar-binding domain-containing protein n=1 Tax=unclassified Amycolatopsis TaxID=2618356 RepID=UPI00366AE0A0
MRVLFTMFPWGSHYLPIVPLGWAFALAGHEVRMASMPALVDTVVESGLPAVPIGPDGQAAAITKAAGMAPPPGKTHEDEIEREVWAPDWPRFPDRLNATQQGYFAKMSGRAAAISDAMLGDLIEFGRSWQPDLIVYDSDQFAGAVAAAVLNAPSARYLLGMPGMMRIESCYGVEAVPQYLDLFHKYGVEPRTEPDAWIDPCPPSVQYPYPADSVVLPMRNIPYNGRGVLPEWLREPPAKPRVCATWGGSFEKQGTALLDLVRRTVDALAELDVEVVAAVSPALRDRLDDLPPNVFPAASVPLGMLMPSCSAVIHHGGAGTALTAAAHGVPQLIMSRPPHFALLGDRVAATGAGRNLLLSDIPEGADGTVTIRQETARLLEDPAHREAAERLRKEIANQPAPAEVVASLEKLA